MSVDIYQLLRDHTEDEQARFERIEAALEKILTNDLVHIKSVVNSLKSDLTWIKWLIVAVLGGMIANVIDLFFGLLKP